MTISLDHSVDQLQPSTLTINIVGTVNASGNLVFSKKTSYYSGQTTLGIGATGVTQGTAIPINTQFNIVTVCGAGANGAILPIPPVGTEITVCNQGATGLALFPPVGHGIDALALNANTLVRQSGYYKILLGNTNHWYTTGNGVFLAAAA